MRSIPIKTQVHRGIRNGGKYFCGSLLKKGEFLYPRTTSSLNSSNIVEFVAFVGTDSVRVKPRGGGKTRVIKRTTLSANYER